MKDAYRSNEDTPGPDNRVQDPRALVLTNTTTRAQLDHGFLLEFDGGPRPLVSFKLCFFDNGLNLFRRAFPLFYAGLGSNLRRANDKLLRLAAPLIQSLCLHLRVRLVENSPPLIGSKGFLFRSPPGPLLYRGSYLPPLLERC